MKSSHTAVGKELVADQQALRFDFGANWIRFLDGLDDKKIRRAEMSLTEALDTSTFRTARFLDIGCGSGLFSLAARRLGAVVVSFDFDPLSVACAEELKRRYFEGDSGWQIQSGSVLDRRFLESLGTFDVVYSWGVLHHTGAMWESIGNACRTVAPGGRLYIAIYNDQGVKSVWWRRVKRTYNRLPAWARPFYLGAAATLLELGAVAAAVVRFRPRRLLDRWTRYHTVRGMSRWHDVKDWIGGYPFEVAKPEAVVDFCQQRGFVLRWIRPCGARMGCNEFVLERTS